VTYFMGVPRYVTKFDRGRWSKLVQNSVTYCMDGPLFYRNDFACRLNKYTIVCVLK